MKLAQKAGLSVLAALTVMTGLVSVVLVQVVRKSFAELEVQQAQMRVAGVKRSLEMELESVARSAQDYAEWVDTSQYLVDRKQSYLEDNYTPESLQNIRIDHVILFSAAGEFVVTRSAAQASPESAATGRLLIDVVRPLITAVIQDGRETKARRSVLQGPQGLVLVAAHPVIPMERNSTYPGGVLVFVRHLHEEVIARLSQLQGVPVHIGVEHETHYQSRESSGVWAAAGDMEGVSASDDLLLAHFAVRDWQEQPVGWVHLELGREVYAAGFRVSRLLVLVVVATGVLFSALLVFLLWRFVTRRLQKTCEQLAVIEAAGRPEARLELDGDDEVTRLGTSINTMLASLANAQAERERREQAQRDLERQLHHAQKLEVIGTFAGGIAHDFNNYLSAIRGWLNLIQSAARSGQKNPDYFEQADRAVQQGAMLARQLLLFSRREEVTLVEVEMGKAVRESTEFIRVALPKSVIVEVSVLSDDVVRIDPGQLQQVLLNLAVNASDAMEQAGIIAIEVEAKILPADDAPGSARLTGPHVWLRVRDRGPGVPAAVLPRIFEPFFTTKPSGKGTGLGLAVVHRIVTGIGGFIHVETAARKGTTFHLYLPALGRVTRPKLERRALPENPPAPTSKGGVLIVDDDAMVREVWTATLTMAGYKVTAVNDGSHAWQMLQTRSREFDVIITDQVMPGMNGLELASRVFVAFPSLPVVMLTAVLPMTPEEMERGGFFAVLNKPVGMNALNEVVARAVARNPARN